MKVLGLTSLALVLGFLPGMAQAEEPHGCDKFKWPIVHEQEALGAPGVAKLASGGILRMDAAASVNLAPLAQARLIMPPQRTPTETSSFAGAVELDAPPNDGVYKVSISIEGWIDVIQDGEYLKPTAFTGAMDCREIRKSVKFPLRAKPLTIQLSNVRMPSISVIVTPE
jgi:hypothetical protein